jgi:EpsG family
MREWRISSTSQACRDWVGSVLSRISRSTVIYAFVLASVGVLAWLSVLMPRSGHSLGLVAGTVLCLFAGLRATSVDYDQYLLLFGLMEAAEVVDLPERLFVGKDMLFGALMALVLAAEGSPPMLFLASAAISVGAKWVAFNRAFGQTAAPLLAAAGLYYFMHDFTQIRVAMALGLLYWALVEFSMTGRPYRATALALAGVLFHASASMLLLYAPLLRLRGATRFVLVGLLTVALIVGAPIALQVLDVLGTRGELDEGSVGTSWMPLVLAAAKIAVLTWMFPAVRARAAAHLQPLLDHCFLLCWVAVGFILGFQTASSALAFRTYELFDAFSVFIVAAAFVHGPMSSRVAGLALCAIALMVFAEAGLLIPYGVARF